MLQKGVQSPNPKPCFFFSLWLILIFFWLSYIIPILIYMYMDGYRESNNYCKHGSHLKRVQRSEVDGNESEPDDAGGVHGEADVLGFVEVLWDLPRLDRVERADEDEEHVVDEWKHEPLVLQATLEHDLVSPLERVIQSDVRRIEHQPDDCTDDLHRDEHQRDDHLRLRTDEGRPFRRVARAVEYSRNSVCFRE